MTRPGKPLVAANYFGLTGPQFQEGPLGTNAPTGRMYGETRSLLVAPGQNNYGPFRILATLVNALDRRRDSLLERRSS